VINENIINKLILYGCKILRNEFLSKYCSFKIGGPADFLIEIPNEQALFIFLKNIETNYVLLGNGTNILFSDKGYDGVVLRLTGDFNKIFVSKNKISSGSSVLLSNILQIAIKNNLVGFECIAGVPGTVGGAVYGNAGSKDEWISTVINDIEVYKNLKKEIIKKEDVKFAYRKSNLENCVITKVNFLLKKKVKNDSLREISKNIQNRLKTQPLDVYSAGSIFKNPSGISVGKLIEKIGLKGKRIGGAQISQLHGNFIVNTGGALSRDILSLIDLIKNEVKKRFNINLEMEIKIIE
jgi:UDP-N-acetylmuramate dehydrogenase